MPQNEIFADWVSLVGVAGSRCNSRIVTRQPHIRGDAATPDEIIRLMTDELGFRQLPARFLVGYFDSLAFIREDIAVFDLRPANIVRSESGLIVPIDSIPVRLNARARTVLGD